MQTPKIVIALLTTLLILGCSTKGITATNDEQEKQNSKSTLSTSEEKEQDKVIEIIPALLSVDDETSFKKESNEAFYVYGTTSANCSSITIQAQNEDVGFFDEYELDEYSYGDTSFRYGIREDWNNLGSGTNTYKIIAYCDNNQIIEEKRELYYTPPEPAEITNYYEEQSVFTESTSTPVIFENSYSPPAQVILENPYGDFFSTIDDLYLNEADLIAECDGEYVYLGSIGGKYDSNSVFDKYGDYGSKYSNSSIWNKYGDYGSKYSDCSPFSKYASNPPMLFIGDSIVGYLSKNKYAGTTVVSPNELLLFAYQKFDDDHWLDLIQE